MHIVCVCVFLFSKYLCDWKRRKNQDQELVITRSASMLFSERSQELGHLYSFAEYFVKWEDGEEK